MFGFNSSHANVFLSHLPCVARMFYVENQIGWEGNAQDKEYKLALLWSSINFWLLASTDVHCTKM